VDDRAPQWADEKQMAGLRMHRGFVAFEGPTLAEGIPLNLEAWQREPDVGAFPGLGAGWRPFVAELRSVLRFRIKVDPRTAGLRRLRRQGEVEAKA
jgi:hypothetical protein